jgi:hypothetical protein
MSPFVAPEIQCGRSEGRDRPGKCAWPPGYSLDRSDPDVLVLRCLHGTTIAPLQYPGRHGGGHRTGGEDAL